MRTLVVAGYGPSGHRLVQELRALDTAGTWRIVVLAEEPRPAYNRIALSTLASGRDPAELALPGVPPDASVDVRLSTTATGIDRAGRTVRCSDGTRVPYDALVLATGSRPFVPPVPGHDLPHCFAYRRVEDVDAIRAAARPGRPAVVIGGGLLGLEAADAVRRLGMRTRVVETAPHLMPLQVDADGGRLLGELVRDLGIEVHCGARTVSVGPEAVRFADGTELAADLVVFSAGIRPRDELAATAGLATGERGGFLVDARLRTADERIWAIGECAAVEGRCHGLVAPGRRMAGLVARRLMDLEAPPYADTAQPTRLKVLGLGVTGFGDIHARTEGAIELRETDHATGAYRKRVLAADGETLLGRVEVSATPR
ncbi:NAD(P)/FAD-dependent oxidoreductase [Streptomyces sp. NPDC057242]|uniref:NAD(P)/FAD-dependent oxidoreductase n=1 Tax=unclassified Streptomyces TaxID=2593676 RepID=UPI003644634B